MKAAMEVIMVLCLNSGNPYHLCHEELVQCSKEIAAQYPSMNLFEAAKWCDAFGKEIDQKLFKQVEEKL